MFSPATTAASLIATEAVFAAGIDAIRRINGKLDPGPVPRVTLGGDENSMINAGDILAVGDQLFQAICFVHLTRHTVERLFGQSRCL
jgi:hypothetical protein